MKKDLIANRRIHDREMPRPELILAKESFLLEAAAYLDTRSQSFANEYRHEAASLHKIAGKCIPDRTELECSACGSRDVGKRMISVRRKLRARGEGDFELQLLKCHSCSRTTKTRIQSARSMTQANVEVAVTVKDNPDSLTKPQSAHSGLAKVSSKKRAKDRKNREGLQAMLESKSKIGPPPKPTTFGLLDFMSKQD